VYCCRAFHNCNGYFFLRILSSTRTRISVTVVVLRTQFSDQFPLTIYTCFGLRQYCHIRVTLPITRQDYSTTNFCRLRTIMHAHTRARARALLELIFRRSFLQKCIRIHSRRTRTMPYVTRSIIIRRARESPDRERVVVIIIVTTWRYVSTGSSDRISI